MTYSESAEGVRIDRKRAVVELRRHGFRTLEDWENTELEALFGKDGKCDAGDLLRWLGY